MADPLQGLLTVAMSLPLSARAELVALLIDSFDAPEDRDVNVDWERELSRRFADYEDGKLELVAWDLVSEDMKRIRLP